MSQQNGNKPQIKRRRVRKNGVQHLPQQYKDIGAEVEELRLLMRQVMGEPNRTMSVPMAKSFHNTGLNSTPRKPKPRGKKAKSPKVGIPMAPVFSEFLIANSSAFSNRLAPPFATTNPQPSIANRASRATAVKTITVLPGNELFMRIGTTDTESMDGNAYHTKCFVDTFGTYRWCGPYTHTEGAATVYPSLGIFYSMAPLGTIHPEVITGHAPLIPQQAWPLQTNELDGSDTQRYVPTCWSLQAINETVIGTRGGDWVTCLPAAVSALNGVRIEDLVRFGSYREHSESEVNFHVPARPVDLAYRHLEKLPTLLATASMINPAGYLCFRNTTAVDQLIRVYAGTKFTIAGGLPATLLDPADHAPNHAGHYENVSAAVTSGTVHPAALSATGKVVMQAIAEGKSVLAAIGQKAGSIAKDAATKVAMAGAAAAGFQ